MKVLRPAGLSDHGQVQQVRIQSQRCHAAISERQHLFAGDVQADQAGHLHWLEMAPHCVAQALLQIGQGIGLSEDVVSQRPRLITPPPGLAQP